MRRLDFPNACPCAPCVGVCAVSRLPPVSGVFLTVPVPVHTQCVVTENLVSTTTFYSDLGVCSVARPDGARLARARARRLATRPTRATLRGSNVGSGAREEPALRTAGNSHAAARLYPPPNAAQNPATLLFVLIADTGYGQALPRRLNLMPISHRRAVSATLHDRLESGAARDFSMQCKQKFSESELLLALLHAHRAVHAPHNAVQQVGACRGRPHLQPLGGRGPLIRTRSGR